jgi:hypothetical protein
MPEWLLYVISGILAGDPWFPYRALLLLHPLYGLFVFLVRVSVLIVLAILQSDDTMISPLASILYELVASHFFCFGFGVVLVFWCAFFVCFCL